MGRPWIIITIGLLISLPIILYLDNEEVSGIDHNALSPAGKVTFYNSTTVYVNANISVDAGETLVIDNTTMIFNCSHDGDLHLEVRSEGSLIIKNGSLLTINRTGDFSDYGGYNYFITADHESSIKVSDSAIFHSGYQGQLWNKKAGLTIQANETSLRNVTFKGGFCPIYLRHADNVSLINCSFPGPSQSYSIYVYGNVEGFIVKNCNFSHQMFCINQESDSGAIERSEIDNNIFIDSTVGALLVSVSDLKFTGNLFDNMDGAPFNIIGEDALVLNNTVNNSRDFSRVTGSGINISNNTIKNSPNGLFIRSDRGMEVIKNRFRKCSGKALVSQSMYSGASAFRTNITENIFESCSIGIMNSGSGMNISNNRINGSSSHGMFILTNLENEDESSYNIVDDNLITSCTLGIHVGSDKGILFRNNVFIDCIDKSHSGYCADSKIINSTVIGSNNGIWFIGPRNEFIDCSVKDSRNGILIGAESNTLKGCKVANCTTGITTRDDSKKSYVLENTISGCEIGILSRHYDVYFSGNILLDNGVNAEDPAAAEWDLDMRGNYWSGLEGYYDNDADGIIDTPYWLDEDSVDHYPLIKPGGPPFNRPPEIHPVPLRTVESRIWYNITLTADDPDGDNIEWSLENEEGRDATIDPLTGSLSFHPDDFDLGLQEFTVFAADRNGSNVSTTLEVVVVRFNNPPVYNGPDLIEAYPLEKTFIDFHIDDVESGPVTGELVSSNTPFEISMVRELRYSFNASYSQIGTYRALFRFRDNGGKIVEKDLTIDVLWKNRPPRISTPGDLIVPLMKKRTFNFLFEDPDPDVLTVTLDYSGKGVTEYLGNGSISIIPHRDDLGEQTLRVTVNDNNGSSVSVDVNVMVILDNDPPEGTELKEVTIRAGERETVIFDVEDPEGEKLEVSLTKGWSFDWTELIPDGSGLILTPSITDTGYHMLMVSFKDDFDQEHILEIHIYVTEGNDISLDVGFPDRIMEGETTLVPIHNNYTGNGHLDIFLYMDENIQPPSFVSIKGNTLKLSPPIGTSGVHTVNLYYSISRGRTGNPVPFEFQVMRNLTGVRINIHISPEQGPYHLDDTIKVRTSTSGYPEDLPVSLIFFHEGSEHSTFPGNETSLWLTQTGNWIIEARITGTDVNESTSIEVLEKEDVNESGDMFGTIIIFSLVILVGGAGIFGGVVALKKIRAYNEDFEESVDHGARELPEGYKAAPPAPGTVPGGPSTGDINENHYDSPRQ